MPEQDLWLPKTAVSLLCGLSTRQFSDVIQARLSSKSLKGNGVNLRIHGPAAVAALVAYRVEQNAVPAGDPLLAGGTSPALESYRKYRSQLASLDVAERVGVMVRVDALRAAMGPAIQAMRGTGDRLVRQFGNEAGDIFNEGVREFEEVALRVIGQSNGQGAKVGG